MNVLKNLWLNAFTRDLSQQTHYLRSISTSIKPTYSGYFLDFLVEIGAWDFLFEYLSIISSLQFPVSHYAYFRASQYLTLRSPFAYLSKLFPFPFHSFLLLTNSDDFEYAFYDYGGLGDYVDNLSRISYFYSISGKTFKYKLIVPDAIFSLFRLTNISHLLVSSNSPLEGSFHKCHISHLLAFIEQSNLYPSSRMLINFPKPSLKHHYLLYNPSSGFKQDSFHNCFSYFKRSPGPSFWKSLVTLLNSEDVRSLSSSLPVDLLVISQNPLKTKFLSSSKLLYSTISQILASKLFISVDTFSAHLSLSLGHPTIVIIPEAYDPRWSYYLHSKNFASDPYSQAVFFKFNPFNDLFLQAFQLANLVKSCLAKIS